MKLYILYNSTEKIKKENSLNNKISQLMEILIQKKYLIWKIIFKIEIILII